MTSFKSRQKIGRVVLAATIGITLVIGFAGAGARAADDDEEIELLDTKIFRNIMKGLGLKKDGEGSGIDYRERSPLVLPSNKDLPPPEADAVARKAAGWPDDPDIKKAKQRKEANRKSKPTDPGVDDKPLLPNQVGPTTKVGNKAGEVPGISAEGSQQPSTPKELGSKGFTDMFKTGVWAPKEEYTPFTGEPVRSSLVEPPKGYRTPSPNQPYGVGRDKWIAPTVDKNEPVK